MAKFQRRAIPIIIIIALIASALVWGGGCGKSEQGRLLRVNIGGNPTTLDPQKALAGGDLSIIVQVFQGLLGFNQDLTVKPVVAEEVPSTENGGISQDGLVYTFKIRHNVTWSDGSPVIAPDFVYSIRRLFDPNTEAPYAYFYGVILNGPEYTEGQVSADEIGVKAIDDYTLEIKLKSPCQSFLERMALWAVYPVRQDVVEGNGDNWAKSPATYIGNGPFVLGEWATDDHITLEKNPNYWGTPAKLDGIRYAMYADASTEYLAYKAGDLDITRVPVGTERTLVQSAELLKYPRLKTNALFFDCGEAPFDSAELRAAFAMAIDRSALVNDVQGGRGSATYCWVPGGMPGYEAGYQQTCGSQYAFNATEARQMMANAGYPDGNGLPHITLIYSNEASNATVAQFVQGQLSTNLGVNIDAVGVGSAVYFDRLFGDQSSWDLAYLSFSADYPDPDDWLPDFFGTDGAYNMTGYSNAEFDAKVAEALAQPDYAQRLTLWKDAEATMVQDAPAIFLFDDDMFVLRKDHVKGIIGTAMDLYIPGDLFMAEIHID